MNRLFWIAIAFAAALAVAVAVWLAGWDQPVRSGLPASSLPEVVQKSATEPPPSKSAPKTLPSPETPPSVNQPPPVVPPPAPLRGPQYVMPPPALGKQEADDIALNIRHFGQRFGGNPSGTNAEIVKALTGDNAAHATYLPAELRNLNDKGELLDQWGTPYFFHCDSATETEVRSAGPDRRLWTADDVVSK